MGDFNVVVAHAFNITTLQIGFSPRKRKITFSAFGAQKNPEMLAARWDFFQKTFVQKTFFGPVSSLQIHFSVQVRKIDFLQKAKKNSVFYRLCEILMELLSAERKSAKNCAFFVPKQKKVNFIITSAFLGAGEKNVDF